MRRQALVFTEWKRRTGDGVTQFGNPFTKAVVEKGIRQVLRKQLLTGHFTPNGSLDRRRDFLTEAENVWGFGATERPKMEQQKGTPVLDRERKAG